MATQVTLNSGSVDSAGSLALKTNGTTTAVTIDTSQNVGIGTTSPLSPLDVVVGAGGARRVLVNYDDSIITIKGASNTAGPETLRLVADNIRFNTGTSGSGSERARIDTSGNVGIGTSSPLDKLNVQGAVVSTSNTVLSASASAGVFDYLAASGSTRILSCKSTGSIIQFFTNPASGDLTERARIDSSGNLLVGTTSAIGSGLLSVLATASTNGVACQQVTNTNRTFAGLNSSGTTTFSVTGAGAVTKASGTFCIDHPLPELEATHNLVHSFIEGPQADLIYRGKVTLVNGTTSVNIDQAATMTDGTFVLLCRNVQCFTTNESDWTAVRGAVSGNILTIEAQDNTSTANISWMVIGERQDKHMYETGWTDDNGRPIVEPLKDANA